MTVSIEIPTSLKKDPEIISEKRNLESFLDYYLNNPLFKGKKSTPNLEIKKFLKRNGLEKDSSYLLFVLRSFLSARSA
jgi:hypothetical protein